MRDGCSTCGGLWTFPRDGKEWRRDNDNDNDTLKEVHPTIVRGLALQA